jgi:anaerobic ribonucleoside-triphosphate reductase
MKSNLSELSYKAYVYLFDLKYFAKSIKDLGYDEKELKNILDDANALYKYLLSAIEQKVETEQFDILAEAYKISQILLQDLKSIHCDKKFINEKTDLIVGVFELKEKIEVIMSEILGKNNG